MSKLIGSIALGAALMVPAFAFAQTPTTGLLNVYVQVLNQSGYTNYQPSNFNVAVSGATPSLSNFPGSQQGTLVSLQPGTYSVVVTNGAQYGYTPSYSVGCNSSVAAGATQTCVITMTRSSYNPPVTPYPGGSNTQALSCRTETPTVALGQAARFVAQGGIGGAYNWYTSAQNFPNIGPVLTTSFQSSGTHTVQVVNAAQTATCVVTVTTSYQPVPTTPGGPYYPTLQSYVYPRFPNTGFEPLTSAQMAFAVVLLMGAGIAFYPYGRKAFALALR